MRAPGRLLGDSKEATRVGALGNESSHNKMVAKQEAFLHAYKHLGTRLHAAKAAGVDDDTIDRWRADPQFLLRYERAKEDFTDLVEQHAFEMFFSEERPSFPRVRLAEVILRAKRKQEYGDAVELTGQGGGPIQVERRELHAHFVADVVRVLDQAGVPVTAVEGDGQPLGGPEALQP